MLSWRTRLLVGVLFGTWAAYAWMFGVAELSLKRTLALLTTVLIGGTAVAMWTRRGQLTGNRVTAALALGSIVNVAGASLVVAGDRLWELGVIPALATNWIQFLVGALGVAGATFTWTRARGGLEGPPMKSRRAGEPLEPAPAPAAALDVPPDWEALAAQLTDRADGVRLRQLHALQRIEAMLLEPKQARRVVRQEVMRLVAESEATEREADDSDMLSQAASLLEWGAQKLPELAELDVSDVLMAKAIADIRAKHDAVEHIFVDHRKLRAIHPIDRATAEAKCNERAEAARAALPALEANGMRLSEELVASNDALEMFRSVTGFQVVEVEDGFVTFEGNGRREALRRAFGDDLGIEVEVRLFTFADLETRQAMARRVQRVRRWKRVL